MDNAVPSDIIAGNHTSWEDVVSTGSIHSIAITVNALAQLRIGDVIGVFNQHGNIAGMVELTSLTNNVYLCVYADNNFTEKIDGFVNGDLLTFKVYSNDEVFDVILQCRIPIHLMMRVCR
jgi:hypothetical protein